MQRTQSAVILRPSYKTSSCKIIFQNLRVNITMHPTTTQKPSTATYRLYNNGYIRVKYSVTVHKVMNDWSLTQRIKRWGTGSLVLRCIWAYAALSGAVITDMVGVQLRPQKPKPARTDFDLCSHTVARSPSLPLLKVSKSVIQVNTRITWNTSYRQLNTTPFKCPSVTSCQYSAVNWG